MLATTLAFEQQRRTGRLPQVGLFVQLTGTTAVFVGDGLTGLDAGVLYLADGSQKADGSILAGGDVQTVYRNLLSVDDLVEGDASGGSAGAPMLAVLPAARVTTRATMSNTVRRMGDLIANEPLIGKRAELRPQFPGLVTTDMPTRFSGEVNKVTLTPLNLILDLRSG